LRIKKIELIGFKSFKDRTVVQFDAGITGIVGPNGCGKSNIVDALVWVMGDMSAKDLRASTMTDVIFAGSEGYAPMGMAEVSLTLENDGGPFPAKYLKYSEVMVTRRLHRSGESEYFINKEPARLRDIQEIFMDTGAGAKGFSIIQQGMIGKIITAKPEDRKNLIEEAAGITKFKARKKESQRKLIATEQNLVRLQDIVGELKRQIDSLQRQAQRAERYRNLKNQIEALDLWVSSIQFKDLKEAADQAQSIFQEAQGMEVQGGSNLSSLQAELESLKLSLLEQEKKVQETQETHSSKASSVQKKELEIQELKFEIEQARRNEVMTGNLLQEQQARQELLNRDLSQLLAQASELQTESDSLSQEFASKNSTFQEAQSRVSIVDENLTTNRRELFALGQIEASVEAKLQGLSAQFEEVKFKNENEHLTLVELQNKQSEFVSRRNKISTDLDRERQMQLDLSNDVESFEANKKILQEKVTEKKIEVDQFKDELNQVASRLYGLENLQENFEGFEEGVKSVMLWQKTKQTEMHADGSVSHSFKPVSEVVEVPSEFEVAMEAALGSRLQMLLSQDSSQSLAAVNYLKESKSGRSSFFEGGSQKSLLSRPSGEGVVALLKDVVSSSEKFQNSVSYLLDGVAVVDSISTALKLRPENEGWTFVTKDGDTLSADGVLTGGASDSAESGVLKRRREIKELSQSKAEWAGKLQLAQLSLRKLEEQLVNILTDFEGAQKRKVEQEIKVTELKKDLERSEHEQQNAQQAVERQQREISKISEQLVSLQSRVKELESSLAETKTKKSSIEQAVTSLQGEYDSLRAGFDTRQTEVTDLQVAAAQKLSELQGVQRHIEMVQKSVNELDSQLSRMSEESEKNSTVMTESQFKLEEQKIDFERLIHEVEELKMTVSQQRDAYEQAAAKAREIESQVVESQRAANERQHRMNEAQLKFEQAKMKEQYLIDQVRERYLLNLPEIFEQHLNDMINADRDFQAAEAEVKDLKDKLGRIGEVNLSAIEEYDETAKRYEFLTQQQTELNEAKEQLKRVIDRINRICSKRFTETFDLVNDRFTRVFPVLFGGGEARLELIENVEKGEMGIDIIAKPPGKKMQNISLLSGGEKALTAVSLVFSIFLVKPSPYCLLDEVDAPLDDANVSRFNELVKEMAKRSQIIVVTHNKFTMEVTKKLYGVTMQERGVSTLVSVNLQDL
jgi:chromosome segregation protein